MCASRSAGVLWGMCLFLLASPGGAGSAAPRPDSVAQYMHVREMMGLGLHEASIFRLKQLTRRYPAYLEPYLALCEASLYARAPHEAEVFLDSRIRSGDGIREALCARGTLLLHQHRFREAMELLQEADRLGLRNAALVRGLLYALEGIVGIARATQHFQILTHRFPGRDDYWYALSLGLWLQLGYADLVPAINRALMLKPREESYHQLKAAALLAMRPDVGPLALSHRLAAEALERGDLEGAAFMQRAIADGYRARDEKRRALQALQHSLTSARRWGQQRWVAHSLAAIGAHHLEIGDPEAAERQARAAQELFELTNDVSGMFGAARVRMGAQMDLGNYPEVVAIAIETLRSPDVQGRALESADIVLDAALALHELGADDIALEYAIEAQRRYTISSFPLFERMSVETAFGLIHAGLGNLAVAHDHHALAMELSRRLADSGRLRLVCEGNLGNTLLRMGNHASARSHFLRQLSLAQSQGSLKEQAVALCGLGKVGMRGKRWTESRTLLTRSIVLATDAHYRIGRIEAMTALAEIEERLAAFTEASNWYARLVCEIDSSKYLKLFRSQSTASSLAYQALMGRYVHCLAMAGKVPEALRVLEQSRTQGVSGSPAHTTREGTSASDTIAGMVRRYRALTRRSCELAALRQGRSTWDQSLAIDLEMMLTLSELELQRHRLEEMPGLVATSPSGDDGGDGCQAASMQRLVYTDSDAVLTFVAGESGLDAFCLTRDSLSFRTVPIGRAGLEGMVADLVSMGRNSRTNNYLTQAGLARFDDSLAHALYVRLVAPFGDQLRGRTRLMIIPDGPLADLPFELLCVDPALPDSLRYLVAHFETWYGSSLFAAVRLQARSGTAARGFLGMGNPRASGREPVGVAHRWNRPEGWRTTTPAALPGSEAKVRSVAAMFGNEGLCLLQEEASERAFKEMAGGFAVLHLGTHTGAASDNPMLFSLLLTPDTLAGEDGELRGYEIAEMELTANLVVLSSCANLGGGNGCGPAGVARSFLEAGVPALVGTAWDIDDADARSFMQLFYRELLAGSSVSASLQQAKIAFMKTVAPQPHRWAPYVLVGRPDVTIATERKEPGPLALSFRIALTLAAFAVLFALSFKTIGRRGKH